MTDLCICFLTKQYPLEVRACILIIFQPNTSPTTEASITFCSFEALLIYFIVICIFILSLGKICSFAHSFIHSFNIIEHLLCAKLTIINIEI